MLAGLILCVSYTDHVLEHDPNNYFPLPFFKLVSPITSTIITGIFYVYCLACLSGIVKEAVGRDQGPCTPSPVPNFLVFLSLGPWYYPFLIF